VVPVGGVKQGFGGDDVIVLEVSFVIWSREGQGLWCQNGHIRARLSLVSGGRGVFRGSGSWGGLPVIVQRHGVSLGASSRRRRVLPRAGGRGRGVTRSTGSNRSGTIIVIIGRTRMHRRRWWGVCISPCWSGSILSGVPRRRAKYRWIRSGRGRRGALWQGGEV